MRKDNELNRHLKDHGDHQFFPSFFRSQRWNRVYLSILDGYSLQNFYRKLSKYSDPFLLVIQDTDDEVFGAYLTNVPCLTEEFIGTNDCVAGREGGIPSDSGSRLISFGSGPMVQWCGVDSGEIKWGSI